MTLYAVIIHNHNTQSYFSNTRFVCNLNYFRPRVSTNLGKTSFKFSAPNIWETVPPGLKCLPYHKFKKEWKSCLLTNQIWPCLYGEGEGKEGNACRQTPLSRNYLLNPLSVFPPFASLLNPYHAGYWSILFAFIYVKIYVSVATDFWRRCFANLRSWRLDLFLDLGGCCSGRPGINKLCWISPSLF